MTIDSFGSRGALDVDGRAYTIYRLDAVAKAVPEIARLPFCMRVLLENLLRTEDGVNVTHDDILALARWNPKATPDKEIAFTPGRVLLQDFTGVPCVVDLAAMRDAMKALGGDPRKIHPLQPVELVIDHSVQVDVFGSEDALAQNSALEMSRNAERYRFLKWGQSAFEGFKAVPPDTGIVHQVNVELLARVVMTDKSGTLAYPDTVVGTDSHTTMVNGLGVLGWGVGGIEAEAAMLGQPASMLIPEVVGVRLTGKLCEGATATDLVLTLTQLLRKKGVVGKFVEYFGPGLPGLALADRLTIANMAPEYGATCGIFPIDEETLRYLRFTGRDDATVALVSAYAKAQGLFHDATHSDAKDADYSDVLVLDLATVEPCLAGPSRPQDRVTLSEVPLSYAVALAENKARLAASTKKKSLLLDPGVESATADPSVTNGSVVICAITSCTNTSNPSVMIAAGLVAKKATDLGLTAKPWVKTSLAPGSQVVTEYLTSAGLLVPLQKANFYLVGYGCTTCIGNSGPLPAATSRSIADGDLVVAAVLSGNRNFEGRVHPEVRANYLASPPLVVAYALAGRIDIDLTKDPIGKGRDGKDVFLRDLWPTQEEIAGTVARALTPEMFRRVYANVYAGDDAWRAIVVPTGSEFQWEAASTYVKHPPYFLGMQKTPAPITDVRGARVLAMLGDSITTDHISPAGNIKRDSPAGKYLLAHGVDQADFNSYGSRRGNHEVMVRGTFANVRLKNLLARGTEGGVTRHLPSGDVTSIFEASERYIADGVPLVVLAGKEYGSGSSRDWGAKGPKLLGVRVVIAESYERIHRSNLVGMGILPLQYVPGESATTLGLTGEETFDVLGLSDVLRAPAGGPRTITVTAKDAEGGAGKTKTCTATVRIDTATEILYFENDGVLPFVLRQLLHPTT